MSDNTDYDAFDEKVMSDIDGMYKDGHELASQFESETPEDIYKKCVILEAELAKAKATIKACYYMADELARAKKEIEAMSKGNPEKLNTKTVVLSEEETNLGKNQQSPRKV